LESQASLVQVWARLRCAGKHCSCACGGIGVSKLPCGCERCDACLWDELVTKRRDSFICCGLLPLDQPSAKQLERWPETDWGCDFCGSSNRQLQPACRNCRTPHGGVGLSYVVDAPADFDATQSRSRYDKLSPKRQTAIDSELLSAAERGDTRRIRCLLSSGADIGIQNDYGQTCLMLAHWRGMSAAVEELERWGAELQCSHLALPESLHEEGHLWFSELVPSESNHPGRGAFQVDGIPESFVCALDSIFCRLPSRSDKPGARRRNFCDMDGWVIQWLSRCFKDTCCKVALPQLRFLDYDLGGGLAAHVDLAREHDGLRSTHTFCLYLTDTVKGETVLLENHSDDASPIASVIPRRGRLFVFPHICPHRANPCFSAKKLLRGDCL